MERVVPRLGLTVRVGSKAQEYLGNFVISERRNIDQRCVSEFIPGVGVEAQTSQQPHPLGTALNGEEVQGCFLMKATSVPQLWIFRQHAGRFRGVLYSRVNEFSDDHLVDRHSKTLTHANLQLNFQPRMHCPVLQVRIVSVIDSRSAFMSTPATAQRTYEMLENHTLWAVAECVNRVLTASGIDYAVVGGVAVCLHGYRRNTVDLDLLIRPDSAAAVRAALEAEGFNWAPAGKELRSSSGIAIQLVMTGESEGPGQPTKFPDPADPKSLTRIEGLPVLSLAELIQAKLACGLGDMRRTHKDFADVVELIAIHRLDGSFARFLDKSVQQEFRSLVRRVSGEA
jgi:hypothetical protein